MTTYWFLQTVFEKSKMRCRALPGQTVLDSTGVETSVKDEFNTQSDKRIRAAYKTGTIFATTGLSISPAGDFYIAKDLMPVTNLKDGATLDPEIEKAYKLYQDMLGIAKTVTPTVVSTPTGKPEKLTYLQTLKAKKHLAPPTPEDGFYVPEDIWWLLIRNIENNVPTILIGPTGSGKTEVVNFIRQRLGIALEMHDMGSMVDPISNLIGVHRLKGGASVFEYAKFTHDIQQPGILLLDELSRAPGGTNNVLFPLLDFRRELPAALAGADDERAFKLHDDCVLFATANVGAEYTGTSTMDRALVDRFYPVELDYMPADIESRLLQSRCAIARTDATIISKVAENVRNLYKKQDLTSAVSTRHTLQAADLVKDGWPVTDSLVQTFLPLFEGTKTSGERSVVMNVISGR